MGFTDQIRQALIDRIGPGRRYPNNKQMADDLGVDPSQLNRFLKRERGLNIDSLGHILDRLGVGLVYPDEPVPPSRELNFNLCADPAGPSLSPDDYLAVPLASPETAAAVGLVPKRDVLGWILVWRGLETLHGRDNLVAVKVEDRAMAPTLYPGDIVLVDRDDRQTGPGNRIMLVRRPGDDPRAMIRRVACKALKTDTELIFYADNSREHPPVTHLLKQDLGGDPAQGLGGSVVLAMGDLTKR